MINICIAYYVGKIGLQGLERKRLKYGLFADDSGHNMIILKVKSDHNIFFLYNIY